jgi:hypothetical protein
MDPATAALMPERPHIVDLQEAGGCDVNMQTVPAGMQLEYAQPVELEVFLPLPQRAEKR